MQTGIEDNAFPGKVEAVAIGADFDLPGQISEGDTSHDLWATCGREKAMANVFASEGMEEVLILLLIAILISEPHWRD
jgi:hypothetical protein